MSRSIAAVIDADDLQVERERAVFLGWASRGRPFVDVQVGREVEFRHGGRAYRVDVRRVGPSRYEIGLSGSSVTSSVIVDVERLGRARSRLTIAGRSFAVVSSVQDTDHLVEVDGVAHRFSRDDAGIVRAPAAALVVGVDVAPDDIVEAGQRLAVVEAMKMELAITSPVSGRVRDVFVTRNVQVDAGTPLIRIEPLTGDAADVPMGATIDFAGLQRSPATDPLALAVDHLESIRAFMLGFDLEADRIRHMLDAISGDRGLVGADRALYVRHRLAIFDAFSDLCAVAREGRDPNADSDDAHVPREYFNSYLRSLDIEREGVPAWFGDALLRALAHYGVTRLDRSPELEESLLRIFCAHQRRDEQLPIVMALLDDQLDQPVSDVAGDDDTDNLLRATLDRLIASTQRRYPAIAGMSRTVRHRRFDQPLVDQARVEVSASMKQLAAGLADADDDRAAKIDELVACPWPLVPILADDNLLATCQSPAPLLEVLTRRYYKIRDLDTPRVERVGEHEVCVAQYARRDRTVHVVAVRASAEAIAEALAAVAAVAQPVQAPDTVVVDVYLPFTAGSTATADSLSAELIALLAAVAAPWHRASCRPDRVARRVGAHGSADVPARRGRGRQAVLDVVRARRGIGGDRRVDLRGGRQVPRAAPDDRPPPADLATLQLRDQPAAVTG